MKRFLLETSHFVIVGVLAGMTVIGVAKTSFGVYGIVSRKMASSATVEDDKAPKQ